MGLDIGALLRNAAGPAADVLAAHKQRDASLAEKQRQIALQNVAAQRQARQDEQSAMLARATAGHMDAQSKTLLNPQGKWQKVETDRGIFEWNPETHETRPMRAPVEPSAPPSAAPPVPAGQADSPVGDIDLRGTPGTPPVVAAGPPPPAKPPQGAILQPKPTAPRAPAGPEALEKVVGKDGKITYVRRSKAEGMQAPHDMPPANYTPVTVNDAAGSTVVKPFNTRTGEAGTSIGDAKPQGGGMGAASITQKVAANRQQIAAIDAALKELDAYPDAVGLTRGLPVIGGRLDQRIDPKGNAARSAIARIGSAQIHDATGANMAIHEEPRLAPFVPSIGDTPAKIKENLAGLKATLEILTQELERSPQSRGGGRGGAGLTEDQKDWDAAVALHGRDKVLKEYGPRP